MPSTTITGLSSGIQWQDTVDLLMQIESQPVDRLRVRKSEYQIKQSAWSDLQSKLTSYQSASTSVDNIDELLRKTASSSDTDKMSVSAEAGAVSGSHTVIINQLAQSEVLVHDGWADLNTTEVMTGSAGKFAYSFAGESVEVDIPDGATLLDLVQLINKADDNPGIVASTIDDGGAVDPLHLVLTAEEVDTVDVITIDNVITDIGGTGTEFDDILTNWSQTQTPQKSEFRIDGFPAGSWITRDSNVVDDALEGVTMTLKETDATGVKVTINNDYASIKNNISNWVNSYNDVIEDIASKTGYDAENEERGILMGDSQVSQIRNDLLDIVSSVVPGLPSGAEYNSLGSIGLDFTDGGKIEIDSTELQEALESDLEAVANLFIFSHSTSNSNLDYFTKTEETAGGTYAVQAAYLADGTLDSSGTNTIGGYTATIEDGNILVGQDGTAVEGLRIYFTYPGGGAGTTSANVRLGTGVAVLADNKVETYNDSIDGLIKTVSDGFQSQVDALEDQILAYEQRLEIKREMLSKKFLAMEMAVSNAQAQANFTGAI
jgi:flagellar hook-associated protein 2